MAPRKFSVYAEHDADWAVCDQAKVAERALLLLEQWRMLGELPAAKSGATITGPTVCWEASYLLRQCIVHELPPPEALGELIAVLLGATSYHNEGPRDRAAWRRAIGFEAVHPPDPTGRHPSTASETAIARHIWGEPAQKHRELRAWRHDDRYRLKVAETRKSNVSLKGSN